MNDKSQVVKESLRIYTEYWNSNNEFQYYLRMTFEWNDNRFLEMMELIINVIQDYEEEEMPDLIHYFFEQEINHMVGTITNPLFINTTICPVGYTKEEYKRLVKQRTTDLRNMQQYFINKDFAKINIQ